MLAIGTSASVYPAATMPEIAKRSGASIVEINLSETPLTDFISDYIIIGRSGDMLEKLVEKVKELKEKG
jgi:NAD-dependent deacetylase